MRARPLADILRRGPVPLLPRKISAKASSEIVGMSKPEKRIESAKGSNQSRFCARSKGDGLAIMDTKTLSSSCFGSQNG
jgi:hypothetical protein